MIKIERIVLILFVILDFSCNSQHQTDNNQDVYFDIYLALYVYPPLVMYEDDPVIKQEYQTHLNQRFEKHKRTNSPLINFMYNYLAGGQDELEELQADQLRPPSEYRTIRRDRNPYVSIGGTGAGERSGLLVVTLLDGDVS